MTSPVANSPRPLTQERCAGLHWRSPSDFRFVAQMPSVLISASELAALTLELPWFFVPVRDKWRVLVPLRTSREAKCPWLRADGGLRLSTVPFLLRVYPFTVLPEGDSHVLGIWQDPDCVGAQGQSLYQGAALSPVLEPVARGFAQFVTGMEMIHKIGSALQGAGVLKQVSGPYGGGVALFEPDEEALRRAPAQVLASLAQSGALGAAHAQLLSRHNLKKLTALKVPSQPQNTPETRAEDRAFLDALTDDLFSGAELKPGALAP